VWVPRIRVTWNPASSSWPFLRSYLVELFNPKSTGTYTWAADVVEVAFTAHGRSVNDVVYLDFTSGGAAALDNSFPDQRGARCESLPRAAHR
jgi:hypothetical protein